jgi:peptidoglycan/LPS O-acetylase OafA/YrhL
LFLNGVTPWALRQLTVTRIDSLAWGGIIAILVRDQDLQKRLNPLLYSIAFAAGLFLAGVFISLRELRYDSPPISTVGFSFIAVVFAFVVQRIATARRSPAWERSYLFRVAAWIGTISYGIYVFHWPIHNALSAVEAHYPIAQWIGGGGIRQSVSHFLCTLILSIAAAQASWTFWESRFLRLKHRFSYSTGSAKVPSVDGSFGEVQASRSPVHPLP